MFGRCCPPGAGEPTLFYPTSRVVCLVTLASLSLRSVLAGIRRLIDLSLSGNTLHTVSVILDTSQRGEIVVFAFVCSREAVGWFWSLRGQDCIGNACSSLSTRAKLRKQVVGFMSTTSRLWKSLVNISTSGQNGCYLDFSQHAAENAADTLWIVTLVSVSWLAPLLFAPVLLTGHLADCILCWDLAEVEEVFLCFYFCRLHGQSFCLYKRSPLQQVGPLLCVCVCVYLDWCYLRFHVIII